MTAGYGAIGHAGSPTTGDWPLAPVERSWHAVSPELHASGVTLREVQPADASALMTMLTTVDVSRVARHRPCSLPDLASRIDAARLERLHARGLCLAVVPSTIGAAVGLFHVREIAPAFSSAEWDFVLAPQYWGRGLFFRVAPLVVDFVFDVIGAARLESRTALDGRSQGALRKLGAVQGGASPPARNPRRRVSGRAPLGDPGVRVAPPHRPPRRALTRGPAPRSPDPQTIWNDRLSIVTL